MAADSSELEETMERLRDVLVANRLRVLDLFKQWDEDDNGLIDKAEFVRALSHLGYDAPQYTIDALFASWDTDGSGVLEFSEFEKILEDKLFVKPITKAAAKQMEAARLKRPKSAAAIAAHASQQNKYSKLLARVADFNMKMRTNAGDKKDLKNNLTRLGEQAALNHMVAVSKAKRTNQAFARDYIRDGLEASEKLWWAQNEARLLSFVHYGERLPHTALLYSAPSDAVGKQQQQQRPQPKRQEKQSGGARQGASSAVFDEPTNPVELATVTQIARGRWSQLRAESPGTSPARQRRSSTMRASASAPILPMAQPSPRKILASAALATPLNTTTVETTITLINPGEGV